MARLASRGRFEIADILRLAAARRCPAPEAELLPYAVTLRAPVAAARSRTAPPALEASLP